MNIADIQSLLAEAGAYKGALDGIWGKKSQAAAEKVLSEHELSGKRLRIAAGQTALALLGFSPGEIDGYSGPQTEYALEQWKHKKAFGKELVNFRVDSTDDLRKKFGDPGGAQCTAGEVESPFIMKLAWNKKQRVTRIKCHERIASSLERILIRIHSAHSPDEISRLGFNLYGGCYNYRKMRGGSKLSTHSWGIALDFDPERNKLRWKSNRARLAKNDCEEWWRIWEDEGWTSLGRKHDYDWMHVQAK